ncbi:MAG TPA: amidohydrolase family protein, partial [Ancylobacter sp.]
MMRLGQKYRHFQHNSGCACHNPALAQLSDRVTLDLSRRGFIAGMTTSIAALGLPGFASAQAPASDPRPTFFTNLRLFDGTGAALRGNVQILIAGSRIAAVDTGNNPAPTDATIVDCGGRVLMPGLIDAHWHSMFAAIPLNILLGADADAIHLAASAEAERTLLRGFTTVRDLGGPAFAFKQAI